MPDCYTEEKEGYAKQTASPNNDARAVKSWYALSDMPLRLYGVVREVHGDACLIARPASMGLTAGAEFSVLRNSRHGPWLISVRGTRLARGRSEAAWMEVEPLLLGDEHEPDR